jgi:formiminoglutamase
VPLFREGLDRAKPNASAIWKRSGPVPPHAAEELARLKAEFGYALLFDAHSIRSVIPHLFDGKLPDFNLGTFNGASCDPELARRLQAICATHPQYTHVLNGRFKGGHITRHYGNPAQDIHAVQVELCQSTYMEEFEPFRYRADLAAPTRWC